MFSHYFAVILLALCPLIGITSGLPVRPFAVAQGNNAYSVEYESDETGNRWLFDVYSDGYKRVNPEGKQESIDTLMVNKETKRLTVVKAMNKFDTIKPRLKMREVLKECWTMTGLEPSELKEVMGYKIDNTNMKKALANCRSGMGLDAKASFEISGTETDTARKACWERLGSTIFSSAIQGAISDFDISKKLIQVKVDNGDGWDHLYYEFS